MKEKPKSNPAPGAPVKAHLKAERVQQHLQSLPGWRLRPDGRAIERARQYVSAQGAWAFATLACRLAVQQKQPVAVSLAGRKVVVTLAGHPVRGCTGGLTGAVFHLARLIG